LFLGTKKEQKHVCVRFCFKIIFLFPEIHLEQKQETKKKLFLVFEIKFRNTFMFFFSSSFFFLFSLAGRRPRPGPAIGHQGPATSPKRPRRPLGKLGLAGSG